MLPKAETHARAVIVNPSAELLEERHRTGTDRFDEVWEGVLHMVPPPSLWHQRFGSKLFRLLAPLADAKGLESLFEAGLYRPGSPGHTDYRQPDLMFVRPEHTSDRGVEGKAELVIEMLSPGDESREKLPFYEQVGVAEVLLVDPETRQVELYVRRGDRLHVALPDERGAVRSQSLEVTFAPSPGPRLALAWSSGSAEI